MTRTYSTGDKGMVRRLDNLLGPWLDVSPITNLVPLSIPDQFRDIETDTINSSKVYVVGDMVPNPGSNFYGIAVTSNAGATWVQPGGDYTSLFIPIGPRFRFFEVSVVDPLNIYACGDSGWVVRSTDGGLTFNKCAQLPPVLRYQGDAVPAAVRAATSLHFITPLIGVVGCSGNVFKTINGGATWILMNSGQPLGTFITNPGVIQGVFISQDQQTIVALGFASGVPTFISRSSDGGATFTNVFAWGNIPAELSGLHLTWTSDLNLWAFSEFEGRIRSTDGGATWTYLEIPYAGAKDDFAGHFYTDFAGFFSESADVYHTLDAGVTPVLSETAPYIVQAIWTLADVPQCFILQDCAGEVPDVYVTFLFGTFPYDGLIVQIPSLGDTCWTVTEAPCGNNPITPDITGLASFVTCAACNPVCYLITDCAGIQQPLVTDVDLSAYVGLTVEACIPTQGIITLAGVVDCCDSLNQITFAIPTPPFNPLPPIGSIINIGSLGTTCWRLVSLNGGTGPLTVIDPTTITAFNDCASCGTCGAEPDCCAIAWAPGCYCVTITLADNCNCSQEWLGVIGATFEDCVACCTPPPPPPLPLIPRVIPDPVKIFYRIKESLCDIQAVKTFAEAYWKVTKSLKFGINSSCKNIALESIWLKKQLSDLSMMRDPAYCVFPNTCCSTSSPCGECNTCNTCNTCQPKPCSCVLSVPGAPGSCAQVYDPCPKLSTIVNTAVNNTRVTYSCCWLNVLFLGRPMTVSITINTVPYFITLDTAANMQFFLNGLGLGTWIVKDLGASRFDFCVVGTDTYGVLTQVLEVITNLKNPVCSSATVTVITNTSIETCDCADCDVISETTDTTNVATQSIQQCCWTPALVDGNNGLTIVINGTIVPVSIASGIPAMIAYLNSINSGVWTVSVVGIIYTICVTGNAVYGILTVLLPLPVVYDPSCTLDTTIIIFNSSITTCRCVPRVAVTPTPSCDPVCIGPIGIPCPGPINVTSSGIQ